MTPENITFTYTSTFPSDTVSAFAVFLGYKAKVSQTAPDADGNMVTTQIDNPQLPEQFVSDSFKKNAVEFVSRFGAAQAELAKQKALEDAKAQVAQAISVTHEVTPAPQA